MQMDNDDNTEQNQFFLDLQKQKDTGITVRILKNKFNSFQMVGSVVCWWRISRSLCTVFHRHLSVIR